MGAADGVGPGFAQPEVPHLAFGDQLADRARHVLDGHIRVDTVLVEHVDVVGAQVAEAVLGDFADVLGTAVGGTPEVGGIAQVETERGGEGDVVAEVLHGAAEQLLQEARRRPAAGDTTAARPHARSGT
ncbi:hypothetical protein GCM10023082_33640 [Streptomyces tremellae]|uniref:Uncharacterized protein n=1 Tax=Streptomyces tremellae TaxID=1124239 RepID=A0ABP7F8H4_9ACTN